jgi:catechol 2,3-dioxygenase-like lactoylglutathione lyase family enzyme
MIRQMSHTNVFVLDQDSAKAFYTEKLGFEERFDIAMGEEFEGAGQSFRWLTVSPKEQPDLQIVLASCDRVARLNRPSSCAHWWRAGAWAPGC